MKTTATARVLSTRDPATRRELQRIGENHYLLMCPNVEIGFEVARVRRDRFGELRADLDVHCGLSGSQSFEGILDSFAGFALSNPRARHETGRRLQAKARISTTEIDLSNLLDELHLRVRRAMLDGDGAVCLADVPRPPADDGFHVDGLPILKRLPNLWAAFGGVGKTTLALYVAGRLKQQGVNVAFVDWEMDAIDHRPKLEALFGADMPRFEYIRATQPLVFEVEKIQQLGHKKAIGFYVMDSAGPAAQGSLKDEESAIGYYRALRTLNRGSLTLAHVPKPKDGFENQESPFGSVFWTNLARSVWHLKPGDSTPDSNSITVGFFHKKSNTSRLHNPIGFELTFSSDERINVRRVDLANVEGLATHLPMRQRIQNALRNGFKSISEIALELEAKEDTVKRTINRYSTGRVILFAKVPSTDGIDRIGNAETRRNPS
jgi:hypothetical protein